jgi:phosphocarrier protein FPr
MKQTLTLTAPLSGWVVPIVAVPDPVFAQKMVGDGIAIDPISNILLAPCEGTITQLHSSHHAITITHESGIEVLIHIGLDTVTLKGQGFIPKVHIGEYVTTGRALIEFDADYVALHARSLLTEIVITNGELITHYSPAQGLLKAGKDPILTLTFSNLNKVNSETSLPQHIRSDELKITNTSGLHARPAAMLVNTAKQFQSTISLIRGNENANAKSVVSILGIEVQYADTVTLEASGADAQEAIDKLSTLIQEGLGEKIEETPISILPEPEVALALSDDPNLLCGVSASPGLAVGHIFQLRHDEIEVSEMGLDAATERKRLNDAIQQAHHAIEQLRADMATQADGNKAAIFAAHQELLEDPDLIDGSLILINQGKSAAFAWKATYSELADKLGKLKNELMAARANDLRDIGRRVLRILTGSCPQPLNLPEHTILIAEDLTPSDTASLDRSKVLGFCTTGGGPTSHVAILARALAIPALAGIEVRALDIPNGTPVILDGTKATLTLYPDASAMQQVARQQEAQLAQHEADMLAAQDTAQTQDGHHIEVVANISGLTEAEQSISLGGEGVGLLRSEFLFLQRSDAPSEEEQTAVYTSIAKVLGPDRTMVVRTLDVGGDKPLAYWPQPAEDNPFLGIRGLRLCLDQPEILQTQISAILKTAPYTRLHIMFPMVTTLEELRAAKKIVHAQAAKVGDVNFKIGIMVEVPATAIMAEQFAPEVDFFSIGTNDLTQYVLAMDRGHPKLAKQADGLNPAVLQLIAHTVKSAHQHGKWVGVCGGLASDALAIPILIGLGVDELSVSVPAIPAIKAQVRRLNLDMCQQLAQEVLMFGTAAEVRSRLEQ